MPSEVAQKENENGIEGKEVIQKNDGKENDTQETVAIDSTLIKVNSEESDGSSKELSESENKENEEPTVEEKEVLEGEVDDSFPIQKEKAFTLLSSGKRHLLFGDFQAAADDLGAACGFFRNVFGEMAIECAESYFNYGCALLELSKKQISPVKLEDKDEEDEFKEENLSDKETSNLTNEENNIAEVDENKKTELEENKIVKVKENKTAEVEENKIDEVEKTKITEVEEPDLIKDISEKEDDLSDKETSSSCNEDDDLHRKSINEDDIDDLQLAWEMFDLAKIIYKRENAEQTRLLLADVLMKCGEVSIEDENFDMAVEDMTESLTIRKSLLPEDSRIIAETLFQLGLAKELAGNINSAIDFLNKALEVLHQRILNLENLNDDKAKEEIIDIKAIIPEIKDRIDDINERKRTSLQAMLAVAKTVYTTIDGASSSTAKPASNINHLVRKRPKEEETGGTPNKVPKLEMTDK